MLSLQFISVLVFVVLGLVLAIPANTCIVIVHLESIRKKARLNPSDVIFLAKGIVNILLQFLLTVQGLFSMLSPVVPYNSNVYLFVVVIAYFLTYYNLWLTAWLSVHYCASITNFSNGFFTWLKGIWSNFLRLVLFLTALGIFPVSVLTIRSFNGKSHPHSKNFTEASITNPNFSANYSYLVPTIILGCIVPFCLSLLCLVLTFSFLVRHVWRVKNNDSGSTRPNLQAYIIALRTIFFLLLLFTSFFLSQVILFSKNVSESTNAMGMLSWTFRLVSPSAESLVIFQASNKLTMIILRRFLSRIWRNKNLT